MKVALAGAPGSGKSALAHGIQQHFEQDVFIVDDYVEHFQVDQGWVCGILGGWIANLSIALRRLEMEDRDRRSLIIGENPAYITCGTLVDTTAYAAATMSVHHRDAMISNDDYVRVSNTMHVLGMLFHDTWPGRYDHVFYLPTLDPDSVHQYLAREIDAALNTFEVPYHVLRGDPDERLAQALSFMGADEASTPDQQ